MCGSNGVSLSFLLAFQEYSLSNVDFVFLGSVSVFIANLQFVLVCTVPDVFVPTCCICWVVVELGTNCSVH